MRKGDICEGIITGYDFPNKGSLKVEDRKVTIKGALEGQKVRYMVTKRKSGMAEGRLLEVLEPSPMEDVEPSCPYFGQCGGCAYQTMSYDNQLKLKEKMVKKLLTPVINKSFQEIAGCQDKTIDDVWEGILGSPIHTGYRNKMEYTFGDEFKDGPMSLGLHKKGNFYDILNVSGCEITKKEWSQIVDYTLQYFKEQKVPFYHKMRHEGVLRNLVVRQSYATGEFLINLVTTTQWEKYGFDMDENGEKTSALENIAVLKGYVEGLVKLADTPDFDATIAGILYTENDSLGDVVQSDQTMCLYGKDYIIEEVMGLKFKVSPFSFFQTNTKGCEVLYTKAREYIMSMESMEGGSGKIVFDLYSGTGTIAQMMSPAAGKVIGIEIVEEAVEAAKENAKLNGLANCEFIAGDVLKAIDLVEDKPDVIILDPPRDGINPKALDKILNFGVKEMVYISCKPSSLTRDLEVITARGYKVEKICAVDQFPRTNHCETVVLLSQQKPDDVIEVEIELDELDLTSAESKATYKEIQEYVLKEHGLKVSNLYISQVKRKCGIEVGENYNLPKSEDSRQPQCPVEKEKAIKDALEHFGMV
ncbi:MAG: 23S rRNA (uracil(1939)-C(5))-methyltransferase RlmD [Lachnospiraceae bacterium]|nr:23S rRNA (uracil(1939)-C(5))-methyltransferase RlmD [Lachnospiraceae bacterium]